MIDLFSQSDEVQADGQQRYRVVLVLKLSQVPNRLHSRDERREMTVLYQLNAYWLDLWWQSGGEKASHAASHSPRSIATILWRAVFHIGQLYWRCVRAFYAFYAFK